MGICRACGCVQKFADAAFLADVEKIYAGYELYPQGHGQEQRAFDASTGGSLPRSALLLTQLIERFPLPPKGRMLDIGCGNGATLRAFKQIRPEWSLMGTELNESHRASVEAIAGPGGFCTAPPEAVPGTFDVISMVHVLEHVIQPAEFLGALRSKLGPQGVLMVEVPAYPQNPFDLLIVDHRTHFDVSSLKLVLERALFHVDIVADDWVAKELTLVAHAGGPNCRSPINPSNAAAGRDSLDRKLLWLEKVVATARDLMATRPIGIFGTSIAATWLAAELETAAYFVDEDAARVGKLFMGRPVLHPTDLQFGSDVFVAMPQPLAQSVAKRLQRPGVRYHAPPGD
jgi:SAM-dependent methyltransferase